MTTYRDTIMATAGLQSYWRLGEAAGTSAQDEIGGVTGTLVSTPTLGVAGALVGDANTAMTFASASSEYATFGANYRFAGTASFTVEFWIYYTVYPSGSSQYVLNNYQSGGWLLNWESSVSKFYFARNDGAADYALTYGVGSPTANAWHHMVQSFDGSVMRIYLDGALIDSATAAISIPAGSGATNLVAAAAFNGTAPFNGSLDEIAIYNVALSGATISAHYTAGTVNPNTPAVTIRNIVGVPNVPATGDTPYRAATTGWQRLAIGATDTIYRVASGLPSWSTIASTLGSLLTTQGDLLTRDGSAVVRFPRPSVDSYLTHASGAVDVVWTAQSALSLVNGRSADKTTQTASNGGSYSVATLINQVYVDASALTAAQNYTVTLPSAVTFAGRQIAVKITVVGAATSTVTVSATAGNVEGSASQPWAASVRTGAQLMSNGTDWYYVGQFGIA